MSSSIFGLIKIKSLKKGLIFCLTAILVVSGFFVATSTRATINGTFTANQTVANLSAIDDQSAVTATPQANVVAVSAVAQISIVTPASIEIGDTFTITINGTAYAFVATDATVQSVVEGLQPLVDADSAVTCTEDDTKVTCTADSAGTAFTISSGATNVDGGADTQTLTANTTQENVSAVSAVAQVNTITIGGTVEAGDVFTATLPTVGAVDYTVTGGDATTDNIATGLNATIQASTDYASQDFTSSVDASVITLTAKAAGTGFTQTSGTTNRTAVAQVVTFTPASVTAGETFRATINGTDYDYTASGGDSEDTVVSALAPLINDNAAVACSEDNTKVTCTAESAGTAFEFAATVVDTIAPSITLLGDTTVEIEYGSAYTDAGATAADNVDGNLTGSIVTVNPVNTGVLGSYTVTYNVSDDAGNAADQVTRTVNVVEKTIIVTATGVNKVYDATTDASVTLSDDRIPGDEITLGYTAAFTDKNVADGITVTVSGISITGGADADNYTLGNDTTAATADITPKSLTVSFTTDANKTYNGNTTAPITGRSLDGVIGAEVVDVTGGSATFADKHIGDNKTATAVGFALTGTDSGNYTIDTINTTTGNVNPRSITITAVTDSKTYNGTTSSDGEPIITSDFSPPVAVVDTANFMQTYDNKNAGTGKTLTPSGTVDDDNDGNNYDFTFVDDTTGIITQKELTVSGLSVADKVYDGNTDANISGTPSLVDDVENDDISLTGTAAGEFDTANAGVNTIAVSGLSLTGDDEGNYTLTQPVLSAEITAKPITITADAQTKVYGDADPALTYTNDPLVGDDDFTGSLTRDAGEDVGTYEITQGTLALNDNYDLTYTGADLTITAKPITVTADAKTKTYGDADPDLTYTSDELSFGDSFNGSLTRDEGEDVGVYDITQGDLALSNNYILNYVGADLTISKATASISINGYSDIYDGAAHGASIASATGVNGENLNDSVNLGDTFTDVPGGTASWTFTGGTNYNDQSGDADITISKADVSITVSGDTATYDGSAHGATASSVTGAGDLNTTATGFTYYDSDDNELLGAPTDAGDYTVVANYDGDTNHNGGSSDPDTIEITPAPLTVTADAQTKVYGDADPALTYTNDPLVGDDDFTGSLTRDAGEDVGTYEITQGTLALSDNYDLTYTGADLTITPKDITITADAKSKVYGDSDPDLTYTHSDLVNGDTDSVFTGSLSRVAGEDAGVYAITSTLDNPNYNIAFESASFTIDPKSITVTPETGQSKVYGDVDPVFLYTSDPLLGGDTFSGGLSRSGGENVNTYEYTLGDLSAGNNYSLTLDPGTFEIIPKTLTISAVAENKVYDGTVVATVAISSEDIIGDGDVELDFDTAAFTDENVGEGKTVIVSGISISGDDADNYTLGSTEAEASANITPAPITVSVTAENKVYDGTITEPSFTLDITGEVDGDDVTATNGSAVFADPNVGSDITVTASGYALEGAQSGNYSISNNNAVTTADITAKDITVTPDTDQAKVYGASNPTLTYAFIPALIGDDEFTGALSRDAGENVNTYEYTLGDLSAGGNYALTLAPGTTFEITERPITVTAEDQSKEYGAPDPDLTYAITSGSLVEGDSFSGSLTRNSGEDVGTYAITEGALSAGSNYSLTFVPANLTIVDTTAPTIALNGEGTVSLEVHTAYTDAGAVAHDNYDADADVATADIVDVDTVGEYTLNYNHTDANGNAADQVTRTVNVVDTTKPVIALNGDNTQTIEVHDSYIEAGAIVSDNYDADLTVAIDASVVDTATVGSYTVTYDAVDAAGNPADQVTRSVNVVDTTLPVINSVALDNSTPSVGDAITVTVEATDNVGVTSVSANDSGLNYEGENIWSGTITAEKGTHTVTVTASDAASNSATDESQSYTTGLDKAIALTSAGKWALISAPTLLSQAPTVTDDAGGAVAMLAYKNGEFITPSADDEDMLKPVNAFYVKTTSTGKVGFKFADITSPTQTSKQLASGWNLVGTNNAGYAQDEFSSILNTETVAGMVTLYVPDTYNTRKDSNYYASWGGYANHDLAANNASVISESGWGWNSLSRYDGYWVFMNAAKVFMKNLLPDDDDDDEELDS